MSQLLGRPQCQAHTTCVPSSSCLPAFPSPQIHRTRKHCFAPERVGSPTPARPSVHLSPAQPLLSPVHAVGALDGEIDYSDPSATTDTLIGDEESRKFAVALAKEADETKCQDIVVLDVAPIVSWTSFMMVASVYSKPQLLAAMARLEKMANEKFGKQRQNLPGSSPWEVLDFGDVVVHLFTAEQREYYDVESFYAAAEEVDLPFITESSATAANPPSWTTKF